MKSQQCNPLSSSKREDTFSRLHFGVTVNYSCNVVHLKNQIHSAMSLQSTSTPLQSTMAIEMQLL